VAGGLGVAVLCETPACSLERWAAIELDALLGGNSRPVAGLRAHLQPSVGGTLASLMVGSAAFDDRREPRPEGALPLHAPRHRPSAAGSSLTSAEGHPLSSAGSGRGVRSSNTKAVAGQGRRVPSHVSKGGAGGVADGGGHGVGGCPPTLARWHVERQIKRRTEFDQLRRTSTNVGDEPNAAAHEVRCARAIDGGPQPDFFPAEPGLLRSRQSSCINTVIDGFAGVRPARTCPASDTGYGPGLPRIERSFVFRPLHRSEETR
jgi:hypothetical protein